MKYCFVILCAALVAFSVPAFAAPCNKQTSLSPRTNENNDPTSAIQSQSISYTMCLCNAGPGCYDVVPEPYNVIVNSSIGGCGWDDSTSTGRNEICLLAREDEIAKLGLFGQCAEQFHCIGVDLYRDRYRW